MATITIRQIDDSLKSKLRVRAAQNGRSMEAEARDILRHALTTRRGGESTLIASIRAKVARFGGGDIPKVRREPPREPPDFR